ncbi:hypothetical protein [Tianweitania sediminis]
METLVWPEQEDRLVRLRLALDVAAEEKADAGARRPSRT